MVSSLLDLEKNIKSLDKGTLNLVSDFRDLAKGTRDTSQGFTNLIKSLKDSTDGATKLKASLSGLGTAGLGAFTALSSLAEVGIKLKAISDIADAGTRSWKQFNSVQKSLDFSKAITGTDQLAQNFIFLEQTSNIAFDGIRQGLKVLFNNSEFTEFSSSAVKAYADVENAAYKLATISVSGNERSINAISKLVDKTRELQKSTGFALDTLTLLNAQYDIASAGFTDAQSNADVGVASVNLAQAGFGSLAGSTNAVVRVLRALGEGSDSANLRAAQLFETTKIGLLTLDQLTGNVGSLASQAKQLGIDFSEVSASLAVLTTQGISADEAATRLTSFLSDVVNVSPEAASALAQFRDEAGKPIQLNATTLKEKGIEGIIKDLRKATNGELKKIQEIFSNQTSQEFATLLIGAGEENFSSAKGRIKGVDTAGFTEEAENRAKTLTGSFNAAFNKSQTEVEKFGQGISNSVLANLEDTNTVIGSIATGSAQSLGSLLGTLNTVQSKLSGIGGFIVSAFTAVAPIAFFSLVGKGFQSLIQTIGKIKQPGETVFQSLKRIALETIVAIEDKIAQSILSIKTRVKTLENDISGLRNSTKNTKQEQPEQLSLDFSNVNIDSNDEIPRTTSKLNQLSNTSKSTSKDLTQNLQVASNKATGSFLTLGDSAKNVGSKLSGVGSFLGKGLKPIGGLLKETALLIGGLGIAGAAAGLGISIIAGRLDTLGKLADKSTIPELQQVRDSLKDLKGVSGLENAIADLDQFNSALKEGNFALAVYAESLDRLKGLFNTLTGSTAVNEVIQSEISDNQDVLRQDTQQALNAGKRGLLDASNAQETRVNSKLTLGVQLDGEDLKTVDDYYSNQISANQKLITLQEQRIASEKANGSGDPAVLEQLQAELISIKATVEQENNSLNNQKEKIKLASALKSFQGIDINIPLGIQIQQAGTNGIQAQIDGVVADFNDAFNSNALDPEILSSKLQNIIPQLNGILGSLETQLNIDPESVSKLRQQLEERLGVNFAKYIASDPALRATYNALLQAETDARIKQRQFRETGDSAVITSASNLGLTGVDATLAKVKSQTDSINDQVRIYTEELSKASTPLERQLELQSQIETLLAKKAELNAEERIAREVQGRKEQLTVEDSLLNIEKAKLALLSQESKFGGLAIVAARVRAREAEKELRIAQEKLKITNQESLIRKEEGVKALAVKADRSQKLLENFNSQINVNQTNSEEIKKNKQVNLDSTQKVIEDTKQAALSEASKLDSNNSRFTEQQQKQISSAVNDVTANFGEFPEQVRQKLFDETGKLKVDSSIVKDILKRGVQGERSTATPFNYLDSFDRGQRFVKAGDILRDKDISAKEAKSIANQSAERDTKTAKDTAINQAEQQKANKEAVNKRKQQLEEQVRNDKELAEKAAKELDFTKITNALTEQFNNLGLAVNAVIAQIDLEFVARQESIKSTKSITDAFSNVGNSLKSLGSNFSGLTTLGNEITLQATKTNPFDQILLDRDKELRKNEAILKVNEKLVQDTSKFLEVAKITNQKPETIAKLEEANNNAKQDLQATRENIQLKNAQIEEQTNLEIINTKLKIFSETVQVANDKFDSLKEKVAKQADLFKSLLDFNQSQRNNVGDNNKALSDFQSGVLNIFGKNNPISKILDQRIQVRNIRDDVQLQQSQAVTEGKKQIIDLTVQKAQLDLDAKMFENALTQTQILADILSVQQGGEAKLSTTDEVTRRINQIPASIAETEKFNKAQQQLIDAQLRTTPQLIQDKLQRIQLEGATKTLSTLGSNLNPYNTDLLTQAFNEARSTTLNRQSFDIGALNDNSFTQMLGTLNDISNGRKTNQNVAQYIESPKNSVVADDLLRTSRELQQGNRQDTIQLQRRLTRDAIAPIGSGSPSVISPVLNFEFNVNGNSPSNDSFMNEMKTYVRQVVNTSYSELSKQVLNYARKF